MRKREREKAKVRKRERERRVDECHYFIIRYQTWKTKNKVEGNPADSLAPPTSTTTYYSN